MGRALLENDDPPEPSHEGFHFGRAAGQGEHHGRGVIIVRNQKKPIISKELAHRHEGDPLVAVHEGMVG